MCMCMCVYVYVYVCICLCTIERTAAAATTRTAATLLRLLLSNCSDDASVRSVVERHLVFQHRSQLSVEEHVVLHAPDKHGISRLLFVKQLSSSVQVIAPWPDAKLHTPTTAGRGNRVTMQRPHTYLQWHGAVWCRDDVHFLAFGSADPLRKLSGVGRGGGQEHHTHVLRQHDDNLLPHNAPFSVVHIVHLVEDDPLDVSDDVRAAVQHAAGAQRSTAFGRVTGVHERRWIRRSKRQGITEMESTTGLAQTCSMPTVPAWTGREEGSTCEEFPWS